MNNISWFEKVLKVCKKAFFITFIFSMATNALMLASPIYTLQVLDRVISSANLNTLLILTIIVAFAIFIMFLIQTARSYVLIKTGEWIDSKLSGYLLDKTIIYSSEWRKSIGSQNLNDLSAIKNFLTGVGLGAIFDSPWSIVYIAVIYFIHPMNALITVIGAVLLFMLALLNEILTSNKLKKANTMNIESMNKINQYSRNAEVIESMGMNTNIINQWKELNNQVIEAQSVASYRGTLMSHLAKMIRMLIQIAIMGTGAYLVLENQMSMGGIIACSIIAGRALAPFDNAIGSWKQFISVKQAYNRIKENIDSTPERPVTTKLPKPEGEVICKDVIYAPPGAKMAVINNFNFHTLPGDIVAIVGHSAAGKSTFVKILSGIFKPTSGNIRLDGADIYSWNRDDIGNHIGYLPQNIELLSGSIKDNISRFNPEAKDEDIIKAAQIAGVHELILSLSEGYDTIIGKLGINLSAGQQQRIGLARAFYGDVRLLILDEPNSNLDQEGDLALQKALEYARKSKITVFIVSHRPTVLNVVNKIMFISKGQIISYGNRDEVLKLINSKK